MFKIKSIKLIKMISFSNFNIKLKIKVSKIIIIFFETISKTNCFFFLYGKHRLWILKVNKLKNGINIKRIVYRWKVKLIIPFLVKFLNNSMKAELKIIKIEENVKNLFLFLISLIDIMLGKEINIEIKNSKNAELAK